MKLSFIPVESEKQPRVTIGRASDYEISRQMSLLRAATVTRIDDELSPENVTAIHGETALLVCTVLNVGDKAVSFILYR